ncbi:MAG TPA: RNA polymerase subunit sigma-70, partial [Anaerolineales bacterium]|nr:RNA polymerase subunit sigma-70 [Anaerolineales bacterium]
LLTHCYRILGSLEDAEDKVQETFLRAWRRLQTYQGKGSWRSWLYKIATNTCLDALAQRPKRSLPVELYPPADPSLPPEPPVIEPVWLEPYPDELLAPVEASPEALYESHERISFAFMIALQELPARQRCALILGDVLDWQAAEIAEALDISVSAVNSLLYRARSNLKQRYPHKAVEKPYPTEEQQRLLLERYMHAWETADVDAIISMLTDEAAFPMPPLPSWYQGRTAIRKFLLATSLAGEAAGRWKLLLIRANGLPGFAFYVREENTGKYLPFALQVLSFAGELLSNVTTFGTPGLFPAFNLPAELAKE